MAIIHAVFLAVCIARTFSQSICPTYYFRCTSGQCINETAVCDGRVDCSDGSDETHGTCYKFATECPGFAFRCAYGACIDRNKICNNVKDCADNSDELLAECKKESANKLSRNVVCQNRQFTCESGQCIDDTLVCDGTSDCTDESDESITQCINAKCPGYSFQCAYGACIDRKRKCNGIEDCKDGSDEDEDMCGDIKKPISTTTLPPVPLNGCRLPQKPNGGSYEVLDCTPGDKSPKCKILPGTVVSYFTLIRFSCSDGFAFRQRDTSYCDRNGEWIPEPAECKKLCPTLKSNTVNLRCFYEGSQINCTGPLRPGTTVQAKCKPAHQLKGIFSAWTETECLSNGTWLDPLFECTPECGIKNSVKKLIAWSSEVGSEYPWHAGLYSKDGEVYFCGGSIISDKAVLTAAHCVYSNKKRRKISTEGLRVAVGKFHRSWTVKDTDEQRFKVREIIIPDTFLGSDTRYENDIAVLFLDGTINIKPTVMPVCIDLYSRYEIKSKDMGTVLGWGKTETGNISERLRIAKLPYYDFHSCHEIVSGYFSPYVTSDKFCAGLNNGTHLGDGDSGGGYTYPQITDGNIEIHFVRGIVSATYANYSITTFTNVSIYIPWLERVRIAIRKSQSRNNE